MKESLNAFSMSTLNQVNQQESLHKLIDMEFQNVDAYKDLQTFINRHSSFTENNRLKNMYKEMGFFVPLNDTNGFVPMDDSN